MRTSSAAGAALCATAMTILGASFAISRALLDYPVLLGQALRYAAAALLLMAVLGLRRQRLPPTRPELARLCLLGATGLAAFNVCVLETLRHADPAVVGTAVGATPVVLALLGPLTRRRRPATRLTVAAGVVVAGSALVYGAADLPPAALAWAAGALGGEVAFSLLAAPLLGRLGVLRVSAYACGFAVPLLLIAALLIGERWQAPTGAELAALTYLAVVLTAGAFPIWYAGVHWLGVERAGIFIGLLPVVALAAAAVLDLRPPPLLPLLGVLLVGIGLGIGLTRPRRRGDRPSTAQPAALTQPAA